MNLSALPDLRATRNPSGPSIADDDVTLNNTQFLETVQRAATTLRTHGISAGDVVTVVLPNTADLVVALFAAWRVGAAVAPLGPTLTASEVADQVEKTGAKLLIVDRPIDLAASTPTVLPVRELASEPPAAADPVELSSDALALLACTSWTSGRPTVLLDHSNLNAMCRIVIDAFDLTSADHSLLVLPLFHVNGIVISTLSPLLAGGRTTIASRFSPTTFFDRIEHSGATYFSAVPTMYTMLADLPGDAVADISAVRFAACGAASASTGLLEKFESRYGIPVVEGYGGLCEHHRRQAQSGDGRPAGAPGVVRHVA
ncbi:class I adenylate-forming enzyme family protein [Nocardia sp. 2YAB30]|uniref:class I adenylate-forming enzyme family protein n=1 Tax=unclassified Nocardia TaxID=2637762 RepID=UPI003F9BF15D